MSDAGGLEGASSPLSKASRTSKTTSTQLEIDFIFVLGCPGAGKGTLCRRLATDYGFYHLSVGDYLREINASGSAPKLDALKRLMERQDLVPAELLIPLLKAKINGQVEKGFRAFVLDGFPRKTDQCIAFERELVKRYKRL
ncbi:bifunctional uridylate/adenylate kinase [Elasticomyces elasticus]|nr:bifunctional uridylate/adenylate kinase [Elasticomyces elasticus]